MKAVVYSFTRRGAMLSINIGEALQKFDFEVRCLTMPKFAEEKIFLEAMDDHNKACEYAFKECQLIVFVGAVGIAVRTIAPYIKNKLVDPAVLSVDEGGNFVIPLLSGHIGGANGFAKVLAKVIKATPVVTTATDVNKLFAVDEWAARNNMIINSMKAAKDFAAALVDGQEVGLFTDKGQTGRMKNMRGKLYSVGIGPGDPELLTLKAVRLLKECDVVALPKGDTDVMTAKNIVNQVVDLDKKEQLIIYMPMTKDMAVMDKAHQEGADAVIKLLDEGKNVVFITLGCPTVYATCIYVHKLVLKAGYDAELVAGVTSICAVAAKLNVSLCERAEPLIVLPGSYKEASKFLDGPGNKVLMKSASEIARVRDELKERGLIKNAAMVERCGLPGEKVYRDLNEIDPNSSYFSVILVKEKEFDK